MLYEVITKPCPLLRKPLQTGPKQKAIEKGSSLSLSQISSTARSLNLQQIESVFKQRFEKIESNASADIYLISDFQKHFFDFDTSEPYDIGQLFLLQFPHRSAGNVLIDTCWLELPGRLSGQNEILSASITNQSTKTLASVPVRLFLNDSLKAIKALNSYNFV